MSIQVGQRFGRLVVIERAAGVGVRNRVAFSCKCDCGATKIVTSASLARGSTRSCGCLRRESKPQLTHGLNRTPTYESWRSMRDRCVRPKHKSYPAYGGRGISVCARWEKLENFVADMGLRPPGTSIDRIDNDGNYEPGNCRWATPEEQARNRPDVLTRDVVVEITRRVRSGETVEGLAREYGVSGACVYDIKYGLTWTNVIGKWRPA